MDNFMQRPETTQTNIVGIQAAIPDARRVDMVVICSHKFAVDTYFRCNHHSYRFITKCTKFSIFLRQLRCNKAADFGVGRISL